MKTDPFEERLRTQTLRPVPMQWRERVLGVTRQAPVARASERGVVSLLHAWFWPHPVAWAGLAACWLAIAGLYRAAAPDSAEVVRIQENARMAAACAAVSRASGAIGLSPEASLGEPASVPERRLPVQGQHQRSNTLPLA